MSVTHTKTGSRLYTGAGGTRPRAAQFLLAAGIALLLSIPTTAAAQTPGAATACGPDVKEEVLKTLAAAEGTDDAQLVSVQQQLYAKFSGCAQQDAKLAAPTFFAAARECGAVVSNLGSTFFEQMSCAGYDPQRRQFAAPVRINQMFGYGGAPLPGSREYVLHCVANPAGVLVPVGRDSVHLANATGNQAPTWQFAVITSATENLQTIYPMNGQTRVARSILSWALPPTGCNYQPIWGNAVNYRIRLDQ